ncbi:MAG: hypothetical protein ACOC56_03935 [Atribacterota bacterium]
MAIIEELNDELFIRRFEDFNRLETDKTGGNFTRAGLRALFEYLNNSSEDTGENIKLDVIGLCCEFSEYKNLNEYLNDYYTTDEINEKYKEIQKEFLEESDEYTKENYNDSDLREYFKEKLEEEISEKTSLIKISKDLDDGFIIENF